MSAVDVAALSALYLCSETGFERSEFQLRQYLSLAPLKHANFVEHVRVQGRSGKYMLVLSSSQFDPQRTFDLNCRWARFPWVLAGHFAGVSRCADLIRLPSSFFRGPFSFKTIQSGARTAPMRTESGKASMRAEH